MKICTFFLRLLLLIPIVFNISAFFTTDSARGYDIERIEISPATSTIIAGDMQSYSAEAFDQQNNSLGDVTTSTCFSIESEAGGSWCDNVYTSEYAGIWTVTGNYDGKSDTVILTVEAGSAVTLDLTPDVASSTSGVPFNVTVTVYDTYCNVASNYTGTVKFKSSDPYASLPSNYTFDSSDSGSHTFTDGVTLIALGWRSVTATDTAHCLSDVSCFTCP